MQLTRRSVSLAAALALAAGAPLAVAQTKWDLPAAYPATNFHTENLVQFAGDVDKATAGKLKITVHANASLFKAPEIKRAVQGGQAQMGEILLANYQNEWQIFGADGLPLIATDTIDVSTISAGTPEKTRTALARTHSGCATSPAAHRPTAARCAAEDGTPGHGAMPCGARVVAVIAAARCSAISR